MAGTNRPQFVMFGSSIVQFNYHIQGWGAILADLYSRRADFVLRGYASWNTTRAVDILDKVFPKDAVEQPSLVILYFGGNDSTGPHPSRLGPYVPLGLYVQNMERIITHIKDLSTKTRIIVLTTPPVNEQQILEVFGNNLRRSNKACEEYSDACVELCQRLGVKVIDLYRAIQEPEDWLSTSFTDGLHFTHEASKIVVKKILTVTKEADWEPSVYWKSMPVENSEDSPYDPVNAEGTATENSANVIWPWQAQWDLP